MRTKKSYKRINQEHYKMLATFLKTLQEVTKEGYVIALPQELNAANIPYHTAVAHMLVKKGILSVECLPKGQRRYTWQTKTDANLIMATCLLNECIKEAKSRYIVKIKTTTIQDSATTDVIKEETPISIKQEPQQSQSAEALSPGHAYKERKYNENRIDLQGPINVIIENLEKENLNNDFKLIVITTMVRQERHPEYVFHVKKQNGYLTIW